jgi:hypothetical protein
LESAIELLQIAINNNPDNLDAYLQINYLIMDILVEEDFSKTEDEYFAGLLKKYFTESYSKFLNNAEYLFYTGITAHLSEWHFGIDIREAETMLFEALKIEPENIIYKWGYYAYTDMSSVKDKEKAIILAKEIIAENSPYKAILESKGELGKYILGIMGHISVDRISN